MALDLGSLYIQVGANTEALSDTAVAIKSLEPVLNKLESTVAKLNTTMSKSYQAIANSSEDASAKIVAATVKQVKAEESKSRAMGLLHVRAIEMDKARSASINAEASKQASLSTSQIKAEEAKLNKLDQIRAKAESSSGVKKAKEIETTYNSREVRQPSIDDAWKQADKERAASSKVVSSEVAKGFKKISDSEKEMVSASKKAMADAKSEIKEYEQALDAITKAKEAQKKQAKSAINKQESGGAAQAKAVESALKKQQAAAFKAEVEVARLTERFKGVKGGEKHIETITEALKKHTIELSKGALPATKFVKSQQKFKKVLENSKNSTYNATKPLNRLQESMTEMAKTATVALGPLNGVASRMTAIAGVVNRQTAAFALLVGTFAGFAVLMAKSVTAGAKAEAQMLKMDNALRLTGNTAKVTTKELNYMAEQLAINTLTSTEFAREAVVALTAYKSVSLESFPKILSLAQDLSATIGGSLLQNTKRLGQVMEDPAKAMSRLRLTGISFTKSQENIVDSFIRTGQAAKASSYILKEVEGRVKGAGEAEAKGLAGAWDTLGERLTVFIENVGKTSNASGGLVNALGDISETIKGYTENTELADQLSLVFGKTLKFMANTVGFVVTHLDTLVNVLKMVALAYATKKISDMAQGFINLNKVTPISTGLIKLYTVATGRATAATATFGKVLMANPVGAAIQVLSIAAGAYLLLSNNTKEASESQTAFNKSLGNSDKYYKDIIKKQKSDLTAKVFKDNSKALDSYKNKLKDLRAKQASGSSVPGFGQVEGALIAVIAKLEGRLLTFRKDTSKDLEDTFNGFDKALGASLDAVKKFVPNASARAEWDKMSQSVKWIGETAKLSDAKLSALFRGIDKEASNAVIAKKVKEFRELSESMALATRDASIFQTVTSKFSNMSSGISRSNAEFRALGASGVKAALEIKRGFELLDYGNLIKADLIKAGTREAVEAAAAGVRAGGTDLGDVFSGGATLEEGMNRVVAAMVAARVEGYKLKDALPKQSDYSGLESLRTSLVSVTNQMQVMNGMSFGDKLMSAFTTEPLDKMIEKQQFVSDKMGTFGDESSVSFKTYADNVTKAGESLGLSFGSITSGAELAAAEFDLISAASASVNRVKNVVDTVTNLASSIGSIFGQLSNMYSEQAGAHKQAADLALSYGRDQIQMYTELADAVYYSNNAQAKSFNDKAIAASIAASTQYEAEKKAQMQSNKLAKSNFENQKKMQIAQAMMSTATAIAGQLSMSPVGPWNIALATAIGAVGAAQVAMISKQSFTPRESGGSIYGGKAYVTSESGPEIFVPGRSGTMISQKEIMNGLTGGGSGGDVNVNFTIQALDTQSGADIIAANRGMIVNIVKQATNREMRR